jgi:hypothetical protein
MEKGAVMSTDTSGGVRYELGDRVLAAEDLGGFLWPKVRRGSSGIVIGHGPLRTIIVHFAGRHTMRVEPEVLIALDPPELTRS